MRKMVLLIFTAAMVFSSGFSQRSLPADSVITKFLYQVQTGINQGQPAALNDAIDLDAMLEISFTALPATEDQKQNYINEIRANFNLGDEIIRSIEKGGHYTVMDYESVRDTLVALYRIVGNGLNYHEYLMTYDGQLKIFDIYVYKTGEYLSETFRLRLQPALAQDSAYLDRLKTIRQGAFDREMRFIEDIQKLPLLKQAIASRQYHQAHQLYDGLEVMAKQVRSFQLLNILAVSQFSDSLAERYTRYYNSLYPNDLSLNLRLINPYFTRGKFDEAISCIDRLMKNFGEDGYLEYLKSNIYQTMQNESAFLEHARRAIEYEPWLMEPYRSLIDHLLLQKQYREVISLMDALKKNTGIVYKESDMQKDDSFREFLASPEYNAARNQ